MSNFFVELRRRNVYKVAVAYAVASWLVVQAAALLFATFEAPPWATKVFVSAVALGFPVALVLAWAFELTPDGIRRTELVEVQPKTARGRAWIYLTIIAGVLSLGLFLLGRYTASTNQSRSRSGTMQSSTDADKSIAVLPFENFSEDKAFAFFADGVQDAILTDLAKIADLKVISRTSVMQYKTGAARNVPEIAKALNVAHVLEGSVQRSANRVRVSAQLIDARNDTHVWAEKYDRELADVFAIQSEIAKAIADQLQAQLSPKEKAAIEDRPTKDLAAYDLYLQGKELQYDGYLNPGRRRENYLKAVQLLEQAVARDPEFFLAHCRLAMLHDDMYWFAFDPSANRLALAERSIEAARGLRQSAAETHLAEAIHFYHGLRDFKQAREQLAKAQRALPNNAEIPYFLGVIGRREARWEEAIRNFQHAIELDPRNAIPLIELGNLYFNLRRYEEATTTFDRALALEPRSTLGRITRARIQGAAKADLVAWRAMLNTIEAESPSTAAEVSDTSFILAQVERDPAAAARALANVPKDGTQSGSVRVPRPWYEGQLAKLRQDLPAARVAFTAARAEAEQLVRAQRENAHALGLLAWIDAELGDKDKAIQEGRAACETLPIGKDAVSGPIVATNLARVYALTGQKDLAVAKLEELSKIPYGPYYGYLRLHPDWDPLRGDPRFEKIVASLAPR